MLTGKSRPQIGFLAVALILNLAGSAEKLLAFEDQSNSVPVVTDPNSASVFNEGVQRWLELNTLSLSFRYRNQLATTDARFFDNGQQRSLIDGRFKLDSAGNYAIHFHVSSGRTFNWAYSDEIGNDFQNRELPSLAMSPPAIQERFYAALAADPAAFQRDSVVASRGWEMYFRQLYVSATPVKQLSFEYGSLGIERGAATEATTYDEDGYLTGERLRILDPHHLFFDQIAVTYAYEGDVFNPDFFDRGERLGQSNYHQFLAAKRFGTRLSTSIDYTFDKGTHTIRQAALLKISELRVIDSVRPEL